MENNAEYKINYMIYHMFAESYAGNSVPGSTRNTEAML